MKVCMVTDLFEGFIGGVPSLCQSLNLEFKRQGHEITVLHPSQFENETMVEYHNIKIAKDTWTIKDKLEQFQPDLIFVMGEMNLSSSANTYCRLKGIPFITFYQTKFPEFIEAQMGLPKHATLKYLEWYHYKATVLSISESMTQQLLLETNIRNIKPWFGGVDTEKFNPNKKSLIDQYNPEFLTWPKPILLCVSRASPEKNLEAFMSIKYPGTKVFLGEGPALDELKQKFPEVKCLGSKTGEELQSYYAAADLFVFSSKHDAFGMVNIEALASGTPVVAYDATGVRDIVEVGVNGYLAYDDDLEAAVAKAIVLDRDVVRKSSFKWSIERSVKSIIENGELVEAKIWNQFSNPTIITLLKDFQSAINLLLYGFYCYLLHLIYGIFNDQGVKESFRTVVYSLSKDLKKVVNGNSKTKTKSKLK